MCRHLFFVVVSAVLLSASVSADTLVKIKNEQGKTASFMSNGQYGRMHTAGEDSYMIIHYASQRIQVIIPAQGQVLDMSGAMPDLGLASMGMAGKAAEKITMRVKAINGSPKIAGYVTRAYQLSANGENCGTLYASKAAMNDSGMRKMFNVMRNMMEKSQQSMAAFAGMLTQCQRAQMSISDNLSRLGAPLRMQDSRGHIQSEVLSITKNAKLPVGTFTIPASYKVVNLAGPMKQGQAVKNNAMPDMGKMLQQMQKSGRMTPEMIKQMKQMQEMFQP
ncbi:MAG: hypothetical protein JKY93_07430 [Gammaproteobacteria bacterium]|nr:hypothetical protein [Gammaproteobacteria bacterium]